VHDVVKNELAGGVMPCKYFGANAAWLRLAVIAHNVMTALKRLALPADLLTARPKRLRFLIFNTPATGAPCAEDGTAVGHYGAANYRLGGSGDVANPSPPELAEFSTLLSLSTDLHALFQQTKRRTGLGCQRSRTERPEECSKLSLADDNVAATEQATATPTVRSTPCKLVGYAIDGLGSIVNSIHGQNRPAQTDANHLFGPRVPLKHREAREIRDGDWRIEGSLETEELTKETQTPCPHSVRYFR
jgi:hypothetical protein